MSDKQGQMDQFSEMRRRAEAILKDRIALSPSGGDSLSAADALRAIHELSVYQIELEMQNESLGTSLDQVESGRLRFSDFYDLSPVGFCSLNEQGQILEANLALAAMLGIVRGKLTGQCLTRSIHPADQAACELRCRRLLATGEPQAFDLRLVKQGGTTLWAHLAAAAAQDPGGARVCRIVLSDISERKQVEAALIQSEQKFRSLFECMAEGVALHELVEDPDGRIVDYRITAANPAFRRHTGIDGAGAVGRLGSEAYGAAAAPYLETYIRVALSGQPLAFEAYFEPLDRHFRISVFSPGPRQFATVFEDITGRKRT